MRSLHEHIVLAFLGAFSIEEGEAFYSGFPRISHSRVAPLQMVGHVEPMISLLVAANDASSLSDMAQQSHDVLGAASELAGSASDLAGSAQASVGESLDSIGNFWGSISETISSAKHQVDDLGVNAISPFQRLGESISNSLSGELDSLKTGAKGAVEGAQTQLGQSVTDNIGNPFQERLGQLASKFGTSPEELLREEKNWASGVQETITGVERVATPSTLFYAENALILPLWVGMVVFPKEKLTKTVMASYLPVVAAAIIYSWLTYECFQNPVSLQGFASGITNLPGLTKGFGEEVSVATAWSHFLAEDLFLGRWVYLDGQKNKVFTKHSLLLCYFFGPVGLLSHLVTRGAFSVVTPVRDIMEAGMDQQSTKASPKASPARKGESPPSPIRSEANELITEARREAEDILSEARSEAATQASSLLEEAETEALLILKGAEVEKEAMLKASKTEPTLEAKTSAAVAEAKAEPAKTQPAAGIATNKGE
ncbi:unnamed protein product [Pylaiella littoralis]